MLGEEILRNSEYGRVRPYPGQSRLHGFLHDLTDLSGHSKAALALHGIGFDEQHVATRRRPGETDDHARALRAFGNFAFAAYLDSAQKLLDDFLGDDQLVGLAFR